MGNFRHQNLSKTENFQPQHALNQIKFAGRSSKYRKIKTEITMALKEWLLSYDDTNTNLCPEVIVL